MSTPGATVNGRTQAFGAIPPHTTALDWLRDLRLTGSKEGCAEGECGACAIMVARPATTGDGSTEWVAVNACLIPAAGLDGQEVLTAEGLGTPKALHPVQHEIAVRGGSQCGYCTPGFVCSMAAEYYRAGRCQPAAVAGGGDHPGAEHDGHDPSAPGAEADAEHGANGFDLHALSGNLCRCTGYRPIKDAAFALGDPAADDVFAARRDEAPPAPVPTRITSGSAEFIRPANLAEALQIMAERPDAQVVAGSTDWGVEVNIRGTRAPLVIAIDRLPELRELSNGADEIRIGAALTLTEIERRLDGEVSLLAEMFPQFASRLIRNGASLGGNLGTGSPIGDAPPALLALEAQIVLASVDGERVVPLADYYTGYRQSVRAPNELIKEVRIPRPLAGLTGFHKIAKRRFDDISSVAVGFALDVSDGVVRRARIGLGGVAATPVRALATEAALIDRPWSAETVRTAAEVMAGEGTPLDDHRASAAYRAAMLGQSLLKLYAQNPLTPTPKGVPA
ncbi:MAG: FAD binding domain-containing protein [Actinomycetota bacterium]|nr:FAD binding domain-containing protein [Actinomycetota bacterium]